MSRSEELSVLKYLFHGSLTEMRELLGRELTKSEIRDLYNLAKSHTETYCKDHEGRMPSFQFGPFHFEPADSRSQQ